MTEINEYVQEFYNRLDSVGHIDMAAVQEFYELMISARNSGFYDAEKKAAYKDLNIDSLIRMLRESGNQRGGMSLSMAINSISNLPNQHLSMSSDSYIFV